MFMKIDVGVKKMHIAIFALNMCIISPQIVGVVLMQETEAAPKLKLKLLKAKLIGSHVAAKVAVAKEIKLKTAIAAAKTVAAVSNNR